MVMMWNDWKWGNNSINGTIYRYWRKNRWIQSKALDLGARIISDLISNFKEDIGYLKITDHWGGCSRSEIILKVSKRGNINSDFIDKNIEKYILERYPDAESHCSGIILGRKIVKRNIKRSIENIQNKKDFGLCEWLKNNVIIANTGIMILDFVK